MKSAGEIAPRFVLVEDVGRERRVRLVVAGEHVVRAEMKRPFREFRRAAVSAARVEIAGLEVVYLREEETALEGDDLARIQPGGLKAPMFGVEIVNHKGDMAIAGSQIIGLGAAFVDGKLQLERGLVVDEIKKRELGKIEAVGDPQIERLPIKGQRPRFVEHADHGMYRLRHRAANLLSRWPISGPI